MEIPCLYKHRRTAELEEWGTQINQLEARLENMEAHLMSGHVEQFNELRTKQRAAVENLKELGHDSNAAWTQVKISADEIWEDLKTSLSDIKSRLE